MEPKSTNSENNHLELAWELIYSTRGEWRSPYIRTTEKLPDGSPGWSVFLGDGCVLNTNMAAITPDDLPLALRYRQHEIVHTLPAARNLLADYLKAGELLKQRADGETVKLLLKELSTCSFFKILKSGEQTNEELSLSQLLKEFGMLVPLFECIKNKLPLACPDARVSCELDDDDDAPTICRLIIMVPSRAAEQYETVCKLLGQAMMPIRKAIDLACSTNLMFFSADIEQT